MEDATFITKLLEFMGIVFPPPYVPSILISFPLYFSAKALNLLNVFTASPLVFIRYTHNIQLNSSTNYMKYLVPL